MSNKVTQELQFIRAEAERCLYCVDAPCHEGCPAGIRVSQFIRHLRYGDMKSAKRVIKDANPMGGICGYLCPSEELCQKQCTLGKCDESIRIRELQKYVCDNADYKPETKEAAAGRVAVVGGGPAGLSCAVELALNGVTVDVYEKESELGGLVQSEIPGYRIPARAVERDLTELQSANIRWHMGVEIDAARLEELEEECDAVFLSVGLSRDRDSGVTEAPKTMTASQLLCGLKTGRVKGVDGTVYVVGGGDSAVDAAQAAIRAGASRAILTYRRSRAEMPATDETLFEAIGDGVELLYNTSITGIQPGEPLRVTMVQNRLEEIPGQSRKGFAPIPGSEYTVTADTVIFALGKLSDKAMAEALGGAIHGDAPDPGGNVYAGGDCVNGGATIVQAVREGKQAARSILDALRA